jgi:hypothetical protein
VEKQEPNTDSILSSRIMQDSSRHRLDMAVGDTTCEQQQQQQQGRQTSASV